MGLKLGIDLVGLSSGHAAGGTRYVQQAITGETHAVRSLGEFLAADDEGILVPRGPLIEVETAHEIALALA